MNQKKATSHRMVVGSRQQLQERMEIREQSLRDELIPKQTLAWDLQLCIVEPRQTLNDIKSKYRIQNWFSEERRVVVIHFMEPQAPASNKLKDVSEAIFNHPPDTAHALKQIAEVGEGILMMDATKYYETKALPGETLKHLIQMALLLIPECVEMCDPSQWSIKAYISMNKRDRRVMGVYIARKDIYDVVYPARGHWKRSSFGGLPGFERLLVDDSMETMMGTWNCLDVLLRDFVVTRQEYTNILWFTGRASNVDNVNDVYLMARDLLIVAKDWLDLNSLRFIVESRNVKADNERVERIMEEDEEWMVKMSKRLANHSGKDLYELFVFQVCFLCGEVEGGWKVECLAGVSI